MFFKTAILCLDKLYQTQGRISLDHTANCLLRGKKNNTFFLQVVISFFPPCLKKKDLNVPFSSLLKPSVLVVITKKTSWLKKISPTFENPRNLIPNNYTSSNLLTSKKVCTWSNFWASKWRSYSSGLATEISLICSSIYRWRLIDG